jgi:ribonuclease HII
VRIAGIDEAGRGSVIGPLVIAGISFDEKTIPRLKELGVKDSKKLTAKRRNQLVSLVKELAIKYSIVEIQPKIIDHVVFRSVPLRRLNYLETMMMAKIIRELKPDEAHVDPTDVNSQRCIEQIRSVIKYNIHIKCEPKADSIYPATSAASILAKVTRDNRIKELREKHGDFNSGYASDIKTQRFIKNYFSENKECPDYMRASWSTIQQYLKPFKQMKLTL